MSKTLFDAAQFTPTQWDTAADKAWFANQFAKFVTSDFTERLFTKRFYRRLSNTFGHIAHYDQHGFWSVFFTTPQGKLAFLEQAAEWPCYGDPGWTYSDVERELRSWLNCSDFVEQYRQAIADAQEAGERAELKRLQAKYATARTEQCQP